jgi:hypothetical protein
MSTDPHHPPSDANVPPDDKEPPSRKSSEEPGEGLGVFRALILMAIFYLLAAGIVWLVWHTFWHGH